ncbi:MAG: hypothetical protein C6I00_05880 [Nitratiruptor sp.]|nr:hypothetical protein [Nitratiruptor sp.]NPA83629.1 hypothetical protein [Campylobacterota bacterium]
MRKELFGALALAALLFNTASASTERMGSFTTGFSEIEEHSQELKEEHEDQDHRFGYEEEEEDTHGKLKEEWKQKPKEPILIHDDDQEEGDLFDKPVKERPLKEPREGEIHIDDEDLADKMEAQKGTFHTQLEEANSSKEMKPHFEDAQEDLEEEGVKGHMGSAKELIGQISQLLHDPQLDSETKKLLKEAKKAIKFYKQAELFADMDLSQLGQDPALLEELKERIEAAKQERDRQVAQKLVHSGEKEVYPVVGYFVSIGPGQYDWIFVTMGGQAYKLVGVNDQGNFQYAPFTEPVSLHEDGHIQVGDQLKKGLPFVNYQDPTENGFDWVITLGGKVYKLEGYDPDSQSFVYTPIESVIAQENGDQVEILLPGVEN